MEKLKFTLSALLVSSALFGAVHAQEWNFENKNNLAQGEVFLKNGNDEDVKLTAQKSLATSNVILNKPNSGLRSVFLPLAGLALDTGWETRVAGISFSYSRCRDIPIQQRMEAKVLEDGTPQLRLQIKGDKISGYNIAGVDTGWISGVSIYDSTNQYLSDTSCELTTSNMKCNINIITCKSGGVGQSASASTTSYKISNVRKNWPL